jgi:hypothetical protein
MPSPSESLLNCCGGGDWDWLMELLYSDQYVPLEKYGSGQLLYEIEKHDGTPSMRWVKFSPPRYVLRPRTYILIDGLQSGEWRYWALRWAALNGNDLSCKGVKLWSARDGKPLRPDSETGVWQRRDDRYRCSIPLHDGAPPSSPINRRRRRDTLRPEAPEKSRAASTKTKEVEGVSRIHRSAKRPSAAVSFGGIAHIGETEGR